MVVLFVGVFGGFGWFIGSVALVGGLAVRCSVGSLDGCLDGGSAGCSFFGWLVVFCWWVC